MPFYLSPIGNEQQFNTSGDPLVGGKIYTYLSGSTTPTTTYTDSTGVTPQANPIILSSLGVSTSPIWLLGGVTTKFVIKDALDNTLRTIDNVSGINDVSAPTVNEWVNSGLIPTYISGTSFSFPGDQRAVFQVDRRVLTTNTAGSRYGTITISSFSAGLTTITLLMDSGTIDSGLSAVFYGIISVTNTSLPLTSSGLVAAINSVLTTPGPIGSVTPNTGAFTTLTGTNGAGIAALNASNLASGTVPNARFPATLPAASAANLTSIPAAQLTGDVPKAQMATNLNASGSAPFYIARAWVTFDGTGSGPSSPLGSGNVASVTDNGVGDYTITFTTALPAATYAVLGSGATLGLAGFVVRCDSGGGPVTLKTTSAVRIYLSNQSTAVDNTYVSVVII